jgi:hypothetical protein
MSVIQFIKGLFPSTRNSLGLTDGFGDDAAKAILENNDLEALKRLFAAIPGNWADRYFYSMAMSRHFPLSLLEQWVHADPASADAHLVYGARLVQWSREARGYGLGKTVTEERAQEFFRRLVQTREVLERCANLHRDDPTPWAYLVMVAIYSQAGEELEKDYFEQAIERDPGNWTAHMNRLTGLTEKYHGSHAQMFNFARDVAYNAREGSLLPALLLKAHSERWKYLAIFEGNDAKAHGCLQDQDAIDETLDAYQRSLGTHRYEKRAALLARINAAGWFWLIGHRDILRAELRELDGCIHDIHWRWVGTEGNLSKAKTFAGVD